MGPHGTQRVKVGIRTDFNELQYNIKFSIGKVVRMNNPSEVKLSSLLLRNLNLFGLWPNTSTTLYLHLYWIYSYILHFMISFTYATFTSINIIFLSDLKEITVALYPTLTIVAYFAKLLNYYYYKEGFINCLSMIYDIQIRNSNAENRFAKKKLKYITILTLFFFVVGQFTIFVASIRPLLLDTPELPLPSWYPLDWKHNRGHFWFVYIHEVVGAIIMVNVSVGIDGYVYYLMGMVSSQLKILANRLENLGTNVICKENSTDEERIKLNVCIKEHQSILELIAHMNKYFSLNFFSQICLSGVVLSSVVYQVTTMSPFSDFVSFSYNMTFMITISTQAFLNSYFGHLILTTSDELSNAAYSSKWYLMSIDFRKDLLILMERLKIKSELMAGKLFSIDLTLFGKIMNFAYRLYSILKGGNF